MRAPFIISTDHKSLLTIYSPHYDLSLTKAADFYDVVPLVEINVTDTKFCAKFVGMIELSN